ncbi:hypothetical protein A5893_06105 [Pedobacter psychrophilus]|uniref:histidine kinase n=1 Tax=Pedobacter psychrophilus TaxID=1826909 RepID=A0A179DHU2_9SPHI|nr:HAMP domain-containing sensor histidine kinase [Pedobacter psychrophilus]OAQ40518.1 hypothetical protein A5893_06105 [Pedobacter psychrophilus]
MKSLFSIFNFFISTLFLLLITSCQKRTVDKYDHLKNELNKVDSLLLKGENTTIKSIYNKIDKNKISSKAQLAKYYVLGSIMEGQNLEKKIILAKNALKVFDSPDLIKNEEDLYFRTLITNGDAQFFSKRYLYALNYYFEASDLIKKDFDKENYLASKFASIYFKQNNFAKAAKYYLDSYDFDTKSAIKSMLKSDFYRPEMKVNNAAFCFYKNNQLDSGAKYYQLFEQLIDKANIKKEISTKYTNTLRAILYDNLAGLNIKTGKLDSALNYANKSIFLLSKEEEEMNLTPLLKIAEISIKTNQLKNAKKALDQSNYLIFKYFQNYEAYYPIWLKQNTAYLYKTNQINSAYFYQNKYINLIDSINLFKQDVNSVDIAKESQLINQRIELNELKYNNNIRKIYIIALIQFMVLVLIIIIIVYRNLQRLKIAHHKANEQNAIIFKNSVEIEKANKNYLRIMRVMAHDLRNPLSGMTGLASVLLHETQIDEENKKMLKLIETTGMHSIEMINELLKTGLANENEVLEAQKLDLKALLIDSVELLQFKAKEKQQHIIIENKDLDTPVFAKVNYEKVWRVINNLVVNAIKFSLIGGEIRTGVKEYKTSVVIYVSDDGVGIPEKNKETVFDMFTEAKKTGTNGEQPFGLGLSISKKIMEKHQGKIWFEDGINGGTIFYLEFPKEQ